MVNNVDENIDYYSGKLIESMQELNDTIKEKLLWKNAEDFLGVEIKEKT